MTALNLVRRAAACINFASASPTNEPAGTAVRARVAVDPLALHMDVSTDSRDVRGYKIATTGTVPMTVVGKAAVSAHTGIVACL